MDSTLYTTGAAAKLIGITPSGVHRAVRRGDLIPAGRTVGDRRLLFTRRGLDTFIARRTTLTKGKSSGRRA